MRLSKVHFNLVKGAGTMRCVHGGKTRVARGNRKRHGSRLKKGCGFQISFVRVGVIDVDPEDERVWW